LGDERAFSHCVHTGLWWEVGHFVSVGFHGNTVTPSENVRVRGGLHEVVDTEIAMQ
jgi:hypothetical protein